jgi:hypothetical protein
MDWVPGIVMHVYNPTYSRGRQENQNLRASPGKVVKGYMKSKHNTEGLGHGSCLAFMRRWIQSLELQKKKNKNWLHDGGLSIGQKSE